MITGVTTRLYAINYPQTQLYMLSKTDGRYDSQNSHQSRHMSLRS